MRIKQLGSVKRDSTGYLSLTRTTSASVHVRKMLGRILLKAKNSPGKTRAPYAKTSHILPARLLRTCPGTRTSQNSSDGLRDPSEHVGVGEAAARRFLPGDNRTSTRFWSNTEELSSGANDKLAATANEQTGTGTGSCHNKSLHRKQAQTEK